MSKKNIKIMSNSSKISSIKSHIMVNPRISYGGDFKSIVTKSTIFVDKSLFIKEVIENPAEVMLITMPRRSGKSANMDMLKRFLNISADQQVSIIQDSTDRKLFFGGDIDLDFGIKKSLKPLNISKEKIYLNSGFEVDSSKLQGQYPVISIDFKGCKGNNLEEVKRSVNDKIIKLFEESGYLGISTQVYSGITTIGTKYTEILGELKKGNFKTSIKDLSELLYKQYGKKAWILIDEYDAAANKAYRDFDDLDEAQKVADLFRSIFEPALKGNEYLEKGVLTGVQYIVKSGMLSDLNNVKKYNGTNFKFSQYYGIDQEEIKMLFDHFNIEDSKRDQIKHWYNGYQEKNPYTKEYIDKYNIWSIVNYLNSQEDGFKSYWEKSGDVSFLKKLLKKEEIKEKIESLINRKPIIFTLVVDFSVDDFKTLKEISDLGSNKKISDQGLSILFSYLFITGYLTPSKDYLDISLPNSYKLPNEEMRYEMENKITEYYKELYRLDFDKLRYLTDTLHSIINSDQENKKLFIENTFKDQFMPKFVELIKECNFTERRDDDKNGIFANEDSAHSIVNYISMQIKHAFVATEIYTTRIGNDDKGRADTLVRTENTGLIIEVKYKGDAGEALKQAKTYASLIKASRDKVFIALNITDRKEITFAIEVISFIP